MMYDSDVASMFQKYQDQSVISKAEDYAEFTLPYLMVDPLMKSRSASTQEQIEHDYQSVGALLLNSLGTKVTLALFPPGQPNFKLVASEELREMAEEEGVEDPELKSEFAALEHIAFRQAFLAGGQHVLNRVIKLLAVAGNCLVYRDTDDQKFAVWNMHSFAVRRYPDGSPHIGILKQRVRFDELPIDIQMDLASTSKSYSDETEVDMYTVIKHRRTSSKQTIVNVTTHVDKVQVGEESTYPEHLSPWLFPVWNLAPGEHYARGYIEDYAGDFSRLSLVSQKLGVYELESLELLNVVEPASGGSIDEYLDAETGDFVSGSVDGLQAYERGDYNKLAAINNNMTTIIQRLSQAFMYTGNMRDAERVTAEEVRRIAQEAELALGGIYSLLAETLQTRIAYLSMYEVRDQVPGLLGALIEDHFKPDMITGVPAMVRSTELQNLLKASQEAQLIVPLLTQLDPRIDPQKVVDMIMNANSVNFKAVSKSKEKLKAESDQQKAQAEATAAAQGALLDQGGNQSLQGVIENV